MVGNQAYVDIACFLQNDSKFPEVQDILCGTLYVVNTRGRWVFLSCCEQNLPRINTAW